MKTNVLPKFPRSYFEKDPIIYQAQSQSQTWFKNTKITNGVKPGLLEIASR